MKVRRTFQFEVTGSENLRQWPTEISPPHFQFPSPFPNFTKGSHWPKPISKFSHFHISTFSNFQIKKMHLFYQPDLPHSLFLPEEEAKHCTRVLRHKAGDVIHVTDGKGNFYEVVLTAEAPKKAPFEISRQLKQASEKSYHIHIAIAPTKLNDRLEWFLEKAIEFGIDEVSLLQCRNSERVKINMERLEKKAISAMKQSLNLQMPLIRELTKFPAFIKHISTLSGPDSPSPVRPFIAYVDESIPRHLKDAAEPEKNICVLIGPEGDFAPEEIKLATEAGFTPVSLGKSRLRTETAGIAACHILNLVNE